MASPGQKRGSCRHMMALFDSHSKYVRCCEKGLGIDPCVEKKISEICDSFMPEQKKQLVTPTCKNQNEHQKKASSTPLMGQVESKGDSSDRGETPKRPKKSSHKSPSKKISKAGKTADFQYSWSEVFQDQWKQSRRKM